MKKLSLVLLSTLLVSACSAPADEPVVEEVDTPQTSGIQNTLTVQPFEFTLPAGWVSMSGTEEYKIRVPDDEYEVYLVMTLEDAPSVPSEDMKVTETAENIQIFSLGCGGSYDCGSLAYDGQAFDYAFTVESDEPTPENLDGVWMPHTDVTREEIDEFIQTVRLAD